MAFQKSMDNVCVGGWVGGWGEHYAVFWDFLKNVNFAKPLNNLVRITSYHIDTFPTSLVT